MLTARMEGVARKLGTPVVSFGQWTAALSELAACRLIVVDLCLADVDITNIVERARQLPTPVPVAACGPHVHEARLAEARRAGCDVVASRGQWDHDAEKLCAELLQGSAPRGDSQSTPRP